MTEQPRIWAGPLPLDAYSQVLPLIGAYQQFYGVAHPDPERNERFFRRFLDPHEPGMLRGGWTDRQLAGYGCLYWTFSSVSATEVTLLNDLYVQPGYRGAGVGLALISAAREVALRRAAGSLRWLTHIDNVVAQRLYDRTSARRTAWFEYEIPIEKDRHD